VGFHVFSLRRDLLT